jgi:hypothetical protein
MESATEIDERLIRSMNSFARRHQQVLAALKAHGEAIVEDRDVIEVLELLQVGVITPIGSRWHVSRCQSVRIDH